MQQQGQTLIYIKLLELEPSVGAKMTVIHNANQQLKLLKLENLHLM